MTHIAGKGSDPIVAARSTTMEARLGYRPQLDGLRAIAIAAVLLHHTAYLLLDEVPWLAPGGFLGVDLFFVLSGFLITRLIIERFDHDAETGPGRFYIRRILRLLPALVAVSVAQVAYVAAFYPTDMFRSVRDAGAAVFYVANFRSGGLLGHAWSLAIEEQFYLLAAPLLLLMLKRGTNPRTVAKVLLGVIGAVVIWRFSRWNGDWASLYKRTDLRADAILVGVLAGIGWPYVARRNWRFLGNAGLAVLIGAFLTVPRHSAELYLGGFTLIAVTAAFAIIAAAQGALPIIGSAPLVAVGKLAYSLYLWHFPVFVAVEATGIDPIGGILLSYGLTILFAVLSWRYIEQPALRLKDRLLPARQTEATITGQRS